LDKEYLRFCMKEVPVWLEPGIEDRRRLWALRKLCTLDANEGKHVGVVERLAGLFVRDRIAATNLDARVNWPLINLKYRRIR
jgi:hypothetical protein